MTWPPQSRRRRRFAVPALALTALMLLSPAASGQEAAPTAEELGLVVETGYDDRPTAAAWLPVEVRIDPARAVAAVLAVESRSAAGTIRTERAIEAAARTPKVYRFLVPAGSVVVEVAEAGREPLSLRSDPDGGSSGFLAGTLGEGASGPALRSEPAGLDGSWVGVDPAWLELSAQALTPLGALVADAEQLDALTDVGARNLAAGVVAGTDLVVVARDGDVPAVPAGLPSPATGVSGAGDDLGLQPSPDAWGLRRSDLGASGGDHVVAAAVPAGRGRVVAVTAAPGEAGLGESAALWSALLGPGAQAPSANEWGVDRFPHQFARLLADSEGGAPTLPWLAAFTAAYVLVVGPVNGLVLARFGRRELAWATVPIITLVFTAGAYFGVSGGQPPVGTAAGLSVWIDGVGTEVATVIARAPTEGQREITLPGTGWTATPMVAGGRMTQVQATSDGVRAGLDLTALQAGGLLATRTSDATPPLDVEAVAGAEGVTVTVTNTGADPVEQITVHAGTSRQELGTLAPGAGETVEIARPLLVAVDPYRDPFEGLGTGPPRTLAALLRSGPLDGNPGLVWAVGTRPSSGTQARVEGGAVQDRGRLVAVAVRPSGTAGGVVSPYAIDRAAIVTDRNAYRPSPLAVDGVNEAFLRFRVPAATDVAALIADFDGARFGGQVEFQAWVPAERQWVPLDRVFPDRGGAGVSPLGEVWVRATGELFPFEFSSYSLHTLEEVG